MRMRSWTARGFMLGAGALVLACGGGEDEESLRDALSRLPRDTTPTPAESAAAAASLPVDTSLLSLDGVSAADDTLPLPVAAIEPTAPDAGAGEPAAEPDRDEAPADTGRSPLRPGPPQDT